MLFAHQLDILILIRFAVLKQGVWFIFSYFRRFYISCLLRHYFVLVILLVNYFFSRPVFEESFQSSVLSRFVLC